MILKVSFRLKEETDSTEGMRKDLFEEVPSIRSHSSDVLFVHTMEFTDPCDEPAARRILTDWALDLLPIEEEDIEFTITP